MTNDQLDINKDNCVAMMRMPQTRSFMYRHLEQLGTFVDTFNPDPYIHSRQSGVRAAGLMLVETLKQNAPEEYKLMIREQHK